MQQFEHLRLLSGQYAIPIFNFIYENGIVVYAGIAEKGADDSAPAWLVSKYTLNSDGTVSKIRMSDKFSIFNNYASLTYD